MGEAVFVFDGGDLSVFTSLDAASAAIEGYDADVVEGYLHDGTVLASSAVDNRCHFAPTQTCKYDELQSRLRGYLVACNLDAALAERPLAAAQAVLDAEWSVRPFKWWRWLDRRANGDNPARVLG